MKDKSKEKERKTGPFSPKEKKMNAIQNHSNSYSFFATNFKLKYAKDLVFIFALLSCGDNDLAIYIEIAADGCDGGCRCTTCKVRLLVFLLKLPTSVEFDNCNVEGI